jgi:hypothetical protein
MSLRNDLSKFSIPFECDKNKKEIKIPQENASCFDEDFREYLLK